MELGNHGERGSNNMVTCLFHRDKGYRIPDKEKCGLNVCSFDYAGRDWLYWYHDSWWGNGSPSRGRLRGSKESTLPSELRHGPNTFVAAVENLGQ